FLTVVFGNGFIPQPRWGHISALINQKIYYLGGSQDPIIDQFFYLDLSANFTTSSPSYTNIDTLANFPPIQYAADCAIDSEIILFGGRRPDSGTYQDSDTLYMINISNANASATWSSASTNLAGNPSARTNTRTVIDGKGKLYIWGGMVDLTGLYDKTMYIYDTTTSSWARVTPPNAPEPRFSYSATLLPDGRIIFIGGNVTSSNNSVSAADINQVLIYDTNVTQASPWKISNAKNDTMIPNRRGHAAVLASDGYSIIIYGGIGKPSIDTTTALFVLDTRTFIWKQINGINQPTRIPAYATATLFQKYMIVAFGDYNVAGQGSSDLTILSIDNDTYTWVNEYRYIKSTDPTSPNSNIPITPPNTNSSTSVPPSIIIGTVLSSVGILSLMGVIAFVLYRRRQKHKHELNVHEHSTEVRHGPEAVEHDLIAHEHSTEVRHVLEAVKRDLIAHEHSTETKSLSSSNSPGPRYAQTVTLINEKLYFVGGTPIGSDFYPDYFYLDLGQDFDTSTLDKFQLINRTSHNSSLAWGTAVFFNSSKIRWSSSRNQDDTIVVNRKIYVTDVYLDDIWTTSELSNQAPPEGRRNLNSVISKAGEMFIFGGSTEGDSAPTRGTNDFSMYKFNTKTNLWTSQTFSNLKNIDISNFPGFDFSATLLDDDRRIVFIGGKNSNAPNNKMIIYGGYSKLPLITEDALAVLYVSTWKWTSPQLQNSPSSAPFSHTATLHNNHMIAAFEAIQTLNSSANWLPTFSKSSSTQGMPKDKKPAIIGGIVKGTTALVIIAFLYCRKRKATSPKEHYDPAVFRPHLDLPDLKQYQNSFPV
ncbi:11679_t:CDS:10, partial [Ambispora gerdemannii]